MRLHRPHQPENDEHHHFREEEALIREEYYAAERSRQQAAQVLALPAQVESRGDETSLSLSPRFQCLPSSQSSAASDRSHVMLPIRHRSSQKALLALEDRPQQRLAIKDRPQTSPAPIAGAPETCLSSGEQRLLRFVRQFHVHSTGSASSTIPACEDAIWTAATLGQEASSTLDGPEGQAQVARQKASTPGL